MADQTNVASTDNEEPFNIARIIAQLKIWGERLLDLTKSNPLLGINRSRVSKLRVITPDTTTLFKKLVVDEVAIKMPLIVIKRKKKKNNGGQTEIEEVKEVEVELDEIVYPGDVDFEAEPKVLHRLLKRIYDNGRTTVEERGVTTLFLTFGTLKWTDPILEESISPLLMVPCQLESYGPDSHMKLKMLDEELQINPALEFYLRKKHHIELPQFVKDSNEEEITVESLKKFYSQVQDCIKETHWKVNDESWLSTFSFESLVIYKDLQTMAEIAEKNPLIAALAKARNISEGSEALGDELDNLDMPKTVPIPVMPADASQLEALTIAQTGKNLVIKGPPGTGKSQTISNLIADALGQGKKVLFVSAKMAALNVVHDRLSKIGLKRFCLEAHSTKAGKLKIIEELKRTLELPFNNNGQTLEEQIEEIKKVRSQLNSYVKKLHLPREPLGKTIYQAIGKLETLQKFKSLEFDLPWENLSNVSQEQLDEIIEALNSLTVQLDIFDNKATHPWRGFKVDTEHPVPSEEIKKNLKVILDNFELIEDSLEKVRDLIIPENSEFRLNDLETLFDVFDSLVITDGLPSGWLSKTEKDLKDSEDLFETARIKSDDYQSLLKKYEEITSLPTKELKSLLTPLKKQFASWTHIFNPKFWMWQSNIRPKFKTNVGISSTALHKYLKMANDLEVIDTWFDTNRKILEKHVSDIRSSKLLGDKIVHFKTAQILKSAISKDAIKKPKKEILDITSEYKKSISKILGTIKNEGFKSAILLIESNWLNGFVDEIDIETAWLSSVGNRCKEILMSIQKMHEWILLQSTISKCNNLDLSNFLSSLANMSIKDAPELFEKRFYSQWVEAFLNTDSTLLEFSGSLYEEKIKQFKNLDRKLQISMLENIQYKAAEPARNVVGAQSNLGSGGEVGILRRELQKRKRIKPLRKLFNEIPHVLQAIKPCMLMSPVSVSTFLKPGSVDFDLVVFDEASQLPTPEAIPSILRGKQVVVAGDENQLPPTSFFSASTIFEEENELDSLEEFEPLESLLDDCIAIEPVFQESKIVWHYRSKDERLIQFSNRYFYNNSLITFPSSTTDSDGRGVHLIYTENGVWDRGRSRTNMVEAKRVAGLVVEQFKKYPNRSLGVASMNASQKEAIENALDELISNKPGLQALINDRERPEPFFVKSLENVQGDERDTIIICVGYAKTPTGSLSLNFGPLNSEGGWRRLNVLVTRAKWQTLLVTSLRSSELSGVNTLNKGAIMLRNYIEYVEQGGKLPADSVTATNDETNDFEDSIAMSLRDRGLVVDEQVGASEYRIDLAIRDPRENNRYVMAVECDGATYHHTKTARDRDVLRQEVLESQGWKIYRVWSTDWFRDREEALKHLLFALEVAKKAPVEESVQATPVIQGDTNTKKPADMDKNSETNSLPGMPEGKYKPGITYHKYSTSNRNLKELLNKNYTAQLARTVANIVEYESPVHVNIITERLKEVYGVSRAGANIQNNVKHAIESATQWLNLVTRAGFLYRNTEKIDGFRIPSEHVVRTLNQISPEEVENAILYLVEDQFGYVRERVPKAIMELFGIGKNRIESPEIIESSVDRLLDSGKLYLSGYTLYLS